MQLKPSQEHVLEALARFRYLTTNQMLALNIQKRREALLRDVLHPLERRKKPLIQHRDFGVLPGQGRKPFIYCLTKYGAQELKERKSQPIIFPVDGIKFSTDYDHRVAYVDFLILLQQYLNQPNKQYFLSEQYHYFDKGRVKLKGFSGRSPTLLHYDDVAFVPDGLFVLDNFHDKKFFAVEIHRSPDTLKILQQINQHLNAMTAGVIEKRFNIQKNYYLLSICTQKRTLVNVLNRVQTLPEFESFAPAVLFTSLPDLRNDFTHRWVSGDGKSAGVFHEV